MATPFWACVNQAGFSTRLGNGGQYTTPAPARNKLPGVSSWTLHNVGRFHCMLAGTRLPQVRSLRLSASALILWLRVRCERVLKEAESCWTSLLRCGTAPSSTWSRMMRATISQTRNAAHCTTRYLRPGSQPKKADHGQPPRSWMNYAVSGEFPG